MDDVISYIDDHAQDYIERLQDFCRQPSIAAQNIGMKEAGEQVVGMLEELGAETQLIPTNGQPIIYAEFPQSGARILSFYNHYDVQPPDPLEEWESDPFGAEIREGRLFARGAADNKGDLIARICAIDAYQNVRDRLPLSLKWIIEGEEEIGSPNLEAFAERHSELIAADGNIWEGSTRDSNGRVEAWLGTKGICYVELSTTGAKEDMHSMWAAIVPNPMWRLLWALATIKGQDERILIPGFYDPVQELSDEEREVLEAIGFDESEWIERLGISEFLMGISGLDLIEKHVFGPTCNICGAVSGYVGEGLKTVLPNRAMVKIDFRLVAKQDPLQVAQQLRDHLNTQGFEDIDVRVLATQNPARTPLDAPVVRTALEAARELLVSEPVIYPMVPGTGPMYVLCQKFGVPSVSISGLRDADSNIHAPNESIPIRQFIDSVKLMALIIERFATQEV
jgi:acetylornithine deacetylase/succinyl-diaminopimelate desuccinylase-like protein